MSRLNVIVNQFGDTLGRSLPKAKLYSFEPGSNTPKPLYSDAALTQPRANPTEADGAGRFFDIFVASGGYRLELRDQFDNFVWAQDNYFATVDGTDLANLEDSIEEAKEENVENTAPYTSTNVGDDYTLTITGGFDAPSQYREGMEFRFTPSATNVGGSPTIDVQGKTGLLGAAAFNSFDGVTPIADNFLDVTRQYTVRRTGSIFKLISVSGLVDSDLLEDGAVSLSKMAPGTEGRIITYDSGNNAVLTSDTFRLFGNVLNSGSLAGLSAIEVSGITSNATMIEIMLVNIQNDTQDENLEMTVGYGATPTFLTASGDYIGSSGVVNSVTDVIYDWDTFAVAARADLDNNGASAKITLYKSNDGSDTWFISTTGFINNSSVRATSFTGGGRVLGSSLLGDLSAVRFEFATGLFDDGYLTAYVYENTEI